MELRGLAQQKLVLAFLERLVLQNLALRVRGGVLQEFLNLGLVDRTDVVLLLLEVLLEVAHLVVVPKLGVLVSLLQRVYSGQKLVLLAFL